MNGPSSPRTLKLGNLLGGGAFGVVYKAHEIQGEAVFAVKFPQAAVFGAEVELADFENEICASREISHPNVVRVVHIEPRPEDLPPYLVMELLEAGTLRSFLNRLRDEGQQLDRNRLRKWVDGLVRGIAAINEKMLHRDLRPENILLSGNDLKIGDFGLSKVVSALTRTVSFKGRQHTLYMAPEAWRLEANTIQLDMYAMGIVLFEMATHEYPYQLPVDPSDELGVHDMHLFAVPRSLEIMRQDLPVGLSQVLARLMEKRPQDRFHSWADVSDKLEGIWQGEPVIGTERDQEVEKLLSEMLRRHEEVEGRHLMEEQKAARLKEQRELDLFQADKLLSAIVSAITDFNSKSSLGPMQMIFHGGGYHRDEPWKGLPADKRRSFLDERLKDPGEGERYRVDKFDDDGFADRYAPMLVVSSPQAWNIEIRFYQVKPPLNLDSNGTARVVCFIWDTGSVYFSEKKKQLQSDHVPNGHTWLLVRTDENDLYGRWGLFAMKNHPSVTLNWCYTPERDSYTGYFEERDRIVGQIEKRHKSNYDYLLTFPNDIGAAFLRLARREREAG